MDVTTEEYTPALQCDHRDNPETGVNKRQPNSCPTAGRRYRDQQGRIM